MLSRFKLFPAQSARAINPILPRNRAITTQTKQFKLIYPSEQTGKVVKILVPKPHNNTKTAEYVNYIYNKVITPHKDSLFIGTIPTKRLDSQHATGIHPGHNFTFATNEEGKIACSISKRPNTQQVISVRQRVPDSRFKNSETATIREFQSKFTSVSEDIEKACLAPAPLFFHIIPFAPDLGLDIKTFRRNIEKLLEKKDPYRLYTTLHPMTKQYIPADNCNNASIEAIFGANPKLAIQNQEDHDQFCQDIAIEVALQFVADIGTYLKDIENLGLSASIERAKINDYDHLALFTC